MGRKSDQRERENLYLIWLWALAVCSVFRLLPFGWAEIPILILLSLWWKSLRQK